jgi:hypothetical protein
MAADYDSPWKEALDGYFEPSLALLFPEVHRQIDWLMELPPAFQDTFQQDVEAFQEEKRMPYITSIERVGHRRGLRKGIESLLRGDTPTFPVILSGVATPR